MRPHLIVAALLAIGSLGVAPSSHSAPIGYCEAKARAPSAWLPDCEWSQAEFDAVLAGSDSGSWSKLEKCWRGQKTDACWDPRLCPREGWLFYDIKYEHAFNPDVGNLCTPDPDPPITADEVFRAAGALPWPPPDLIIQPPGGRTLVNFETIFYTSTTESVSHDVEIRHKDVHIVGTPTSYTFNWGDGTSPLTTSDAGAAYPHQTVTHIYTNSDVTFAPFVTATYSLTYTVGKQDPKPVPQGIEVEGDSQELTVVEAKPRLVQ